MKTENQLKFVRDTLKTMSPADWNEVAVKSRVTLRTVYNVQNPSGRPGYDVVFRIYDALKNRPAAAREK